MNSEKKVPIYKKWWFWVIIVVLLASVGAGLKSDEKKTDTEPGYTTAEDVKKQVADASKENDEYMDAMRKCTVMEAADIYITGIGQKSDNVFNDANEGCREDYKNIYNGDNEKFISDVAIAWAERKDEMIDGQPLTHYLEVLGW